MKTSLLILALAASASAAPLKGKTHMFRAQYDPPVDPRHEEFIARLKKAHVLERFIEVGAQVRLPTPLFIRFSSCRGISNAWYEPATHTVTFCYEYADEIDREVRAKEVNPDQAW